MNSPSDVVQFRREYQIIINCNRLTPAACGTTPTGTHTRGRRGDGLGYAPMGNDRTKAREHERRYREKNKAKRAEYDREYYKENKEAILERCRRYREENRDRVNARRRAARANRTPGKRASDNAKNQEYKRLHPDRNRAHAAVRAAVLRGDLEAGPCAVCGVTDGVQAHHEDYAKPLEVMWLCRIHHAEKHLVKEDG